MLQVRLLGSFELKYGKKPVDLSSRAAQSLFAYLILNAGTSYRREKLAAQLWPESTDESARDYLRHALWRIRKALQAASSATYLQADDLTLSFAASKEYWMDAAALKAVSEDSSAEELMTALSAYQGELLPGFYEEWVVLEREHLQAVYEQKMGHLLTELEGAGRWSEVVEWGEKWIAFGQKPEAAYRALMNAHAANGDMSRVVAVYDRCRKALAEFGVEPSEQTRSLYDSLKSGGGIPGDGVGPPKAERTWAGPVSGSIPLPLTSFVGRDSEIKEIAKTLASSRLVTLTGPGGVGKTRLAIQTARGSLKKFRDGVFWVGLVGLSDEKLIPHEIAKSLQVREVAAESLIDTLKHQLETRELLLVLDNCEHLIRACADYVEELLGACPQLKILATSIEGLGLFNETVWKVPSMPLPEAHGAAALADLGQYASIELFVARSRNAQSDFTLTAKNAGSVLQICQRLDGIPLAIELAAARTRVLSVDEIAARLDDRFSLLTSGSRTAIPRHQTLRATLDWSHELLSDAERVLFRRLAVFVGGFTLEAAETVCSDGDFKSNAILDSLGRLTDKSLVVVESAAGAGETRYRLLETIRQYALEKLTESKEGKELRGRHLEYFTQLAEEAETHLDGALQLDWMDRLEEEIDNIRIALAWSMSEPAGLNARHPRIDREKGLRLVGALAHFWERSHYREGLEFLDQILVKPGAPTIGLAKAVAAKGFLFWSSLDQSTAGTYLREAARIARQLEDEPILAFAEGFLGAVYTTLGDYDQAERCLKESLEIGKRLDPDLQNVVSRGLGFLADVPLAHGRDEEARRLYEESAAMARETNDINTLTYCSRRLGYIALRQREYATANECFLESLQWNQQIRHFIGVNRCIAAFACLRAAQGKLQLATQLSGAVEAFVTATSSALFRWDADVFYSNLSKLRADLTEPVFKKAWTKGSTMSQEEAVDLVLRGA